MKTKRRSLSILLVVLLPMVLGAPSIVAAATPTPWATETARPTLTAYVAPVCDATSVIPTGAIPTIDPDEFATPTPCGLGTPGGGSCGSGGGHGTPAGWESPTPEGTGTPSGPTVVPSATLTGGTLVFDRIVVGNNGTGWAEQTVNITCSQYLNGFTCTGSFQASAGVHHGSVRHIYFDVLGAASWYLVADATATGDFHYATPKIDTLRWSEGASDIGVGFAEQSKTFTLQTEGEKYISISVSTSSSFSTTFTFTFWMMPQPVIPTPGPATATPTITPTSTPGCNPGTGEVVPGDPIAIINPPETVFRGCYQVLSPIGLTLPSVSWSPFELPSEIGFPGWSICVYTVEMAAKFAGVDWILILGGIVSFMAIAGIYQVLKTNASA